ncbi:hypothetical protein NIBR502774_14105 (plasmid) [Rhizobium sp. NIBRBAC000502774]|nr:hypothetical protein NIBR502774_14105 [Rhizobium sp. NIBRBAC000502774]
MLQPKDRPEDPNAISDADFFKNVRRLNTLTLPLICSAHNVGQPKERSFLVFHNRRALIHGMDDFIQPDKGRVVSNKKFTA